MSKDLPVTIYAGFVLVGFLGIATLTSMALGRADSYDACVAEAVEGAHSEKEFREAVEGSRCHEVEAKAEAGEAVLRALFD
jgi:hypothetical protein